MRITSGAVVLVSVETGSALGMVFDIIEGETSSAKVVVPSKVFDPIETCMAKLIVPKK